MASKANSEPTEIQRQFPVFIHEDFDFPIGEYGWLIGANSTYPEELIKRLMASLISYQLNLRSIDRVYQKYAQEASITMGDYTRLDLRITRCVTFSMELMNKQLYEITYLDEKRLGEVLCEWTLIRLPFAFKVLLSCANNGAFFESLAIARANLEQVAWAVAVDPIYDAEPIKRTSATRSMKHLNSLHQGAGRLYGWLSEHAHWEYGGHIKALTSKEGQMGTMLASPLFKARAMGVVLVLSDIARLAFEKTKYSSLTEDIFSRAKEHMRNFEGAEDTIDSLMTELLRCAPDDPDLNSLAGFLRARDALDTAGT